MVKISVSNIAITLNIGWVRFSVRVTIRYGQTKPKQNKPNETKLNNKASSNLYF